MPGHPELPPTMAHMGARPGGTFGPVVQQVGLPGEPSWRRSCRIVTSRAGHSKAGKATRKRMPTGPAQAGGRGGDWNPEGGFRPPGHPLCGTTSCAKTPPPLVPQPQTPGQGGQCPEHRGRVQGGGPASKPQRWVKGTLFVLSETLDHTFHPPLLPTSCHWAYRVEISRAGHPERLQQLTPPPSRHLRPRWGPRYPHQAGGAAPGWGAGGEGEEVGRLQSVSNPQKPSVPGPRVTCVEGLPAP